MNKSSGLVHGIGTNDGKYPIKKDDKLTREYDLWKSLLRRCTSKLWCEHPTYIGTTCSENFKSYTLFYEWCSKQVGFRNIDEKGNSWQIDKDILIKGNKVYSEDTCVFVPQRINVLLTKRNTKRGELPIGVCWDNIARMFLAQCNNGSGTSKNLGRFKTKEKAFQAYKTFKEALIKEVAEQYKSQIDPRAYKALINYEVSIDD